MEKVTNLDEYRKRTGAVEGAAEKTVTVPPNIAETQRNPNELLEVAAGNAGLRAYEIAEIMVILSLIKERDPKLAAEMEVLLNKFRSGGEHARAISKMGMDLTDLLSSLRGSYKGAVSPDEIESLAYKLQQGINDNTRYVLTGRKKGKPME